MIFLFILIAIAVGLGIARKYSPATKTQKVVTSILFPVIIGIMINTILAAAMNSRYNSFWYNYGSAFALVGIPTLALIITLLVKVKVAVKQDIAVENRIQKLHYGTGENRVDFEMELTEQEIAKMDELRKKDPERWMDNDLELVKAVNRELMGKAPIHEEVPQQLCENAAEEKTVQTLHYGTGANRVDFEMELTDSEIRKMEELRRDNSEKWLDNDLELVKAAKKALQEGAITEGQETFDVENDEFASVENEPIETTKEQDDDKSKDNIILTGAKLESEYRKELAAGQHWIRQNGTEMCINIDDATYQRMIKMQNENPKKWVDNEFNLFLAAKAEKRNNNKGQKCCCFISRHIKKIPRPARDLCIALSVCFIGQYV